VRLGLVTTCTVPRALTTHGRRATGNECGAADRENCGAHSPSKVEGPGFGVILTVQHRTWAPRPSSEGRLKMRRSPRQDLAAGQRSEHGRRGSTSGKQHLACGGASKGFTKCHGLTGLHTHINAIIGCR
jgi:hypothetical protein